MGDKALAPTWACLLLAQSRHKLVHCTCPLSGVKRTNFGAGFRLRLRCNDLLKIWRVDRLSKKAPG
jgi:hypothetical protein